MVESISYRQLFSAENANSEVVKNLRLAADANNDGTATDTEVTDFATDLETAAVNTLDLKDASINGQMTEKEIRAYGKFLQTKAAIKERALPGKGNNKIAQEEIKAEKKKSGYLLKAADLMAEKNTLLLKQNLFQDSIKAERLEGDISDEKISLVRDLMELADKNGDGNGTVSTDEALALASEIEMNSPVAAQDKDITADEIMNYSNSLFGQAEALNASLKKSMKEKAEIKAATKAALAAKVRKLEKTVMKPAEKIDAAVASADNADLTIVDAIQGLNSKGMILSNVAIDLSVNKEDLTAK
ncbi:MAG: hypothetical protein V4691_05550 [Pseudomonadota bacterium]